MPRYEMLTRGRSWSDINHYTPAESIEDGRKFRETGLVITLNVILLLTIWFKVRTLASLGTALLTFLSSPVWDIYRS